jgi:perosamine synthetase
MLFLRDHGRLPGDVTYRSVEVAYKYKMSELQAAMGRVQLDRIDELVSRKRQIFDWYAQRLVDAPLALNTERPGDRNTFWMITAVLDPTAGIAADGLAEQLKSLNIATRPFFAPLSSLGAYAQSPHSARAAQRNRVSYDLGPLGINLPSALTLTEVDVDRVCQAIQQIISAAGTAASR